jgi:RNA polymerase sigma factor (sigma-70 family)
MTPPQLGPVLDYARRFGGAAGDDTPDGELLRRFARGGDAAAFEQLLRRHGAMVRGVCRRVLRDGPDADDAFQATFLLLVRKAGRLRRPDRLGPWLHGVALRTALKARERAARRREGPVGVEPAVPPAAETADWRPALDAAIARLPARERVAVVMCYLDGLTYAEAASRLRCPLGTLAARLARARDRLRARLTRQGLAPPAGLMPAGLAAESVPPELVAATVRGAVALASGAAGGVVPASVLTLVEGVRRAMLMHAWKVALAVLVALGATGTGVGVLVARTAGLLTPEQPPDPKPARALVNPPPAVPAKPGEGERVVPLALLRQETPKRYLVDAGDTLGIFVEGILGKIGEPPAIIQPPPGANLPPAVGYPIVVQEDGALMLPLIDPLQAKGRSIPEIQELIREVYIRAGNLVRGRERITVTLARPRTYRVTVVRQDLSGAPPNVLRAAGASLDLAAYENDVLTALAKSGGLPSLDANHTIVIQRLRDPTAADAAATQEIRIPLRLRPGQSFPRPEDVILKSGDVLIVESGPAAQPADAATAARMAEGPPVLTLAVAAPDGRILVQMPAAGGAAGPWQLFDAARVTATESDGKPIDAKALADRLQKMTTVLVADGRPPAAAYLQAIKAGTMVLLVPAAAR